MQITSTMQEHHLIGHCDLNDDDLLCPPNTKVLMFCCERGHEHLQTGCPASLHTSPTALSKRKLIVLDHSTLT